MHCRQGLRLYLGKHRPQAGMKQQRLLVAHKELIELQIEIGHERGNSEYVRRDLRDSRHWNLRV